MTLSENCLHPKEFESEGVKELVLSRISVVQ